MSRLLSPRTVEIVKRVKAGERPAWVAKSLGLRPQSVHGTLLRFGSRSLIVCDWCGHGAVRVGGPAASPPAGWQQIARGREHDTTCPWCAVPAGPSQLQTARPYATVGRRG